MVSSILLACATLAFADDPVEADYYRIVDVAVPEELVFEVGAIALLEDGRPMVATRRGQVWILENAYEAGAEVVCKLYTEGLQEPLGLLVHPDGWIYTCQRGEVSRMRDVDGDDVMDQLETVADIGISGNYHEYLFGPRLGADGDLWITANRPFGDEPFGRAPWRGFALRISTDGKVTPTCSGLRSPAGIEVAPWGDAFYTDNQGEWCGASKLSHLEPGDFHGHPWGIESCKLAAWEYGYPGDPPNGMLMPLVPDVIPSFKLPAVWFPYDKMGKSPAGMVWDTTGGAFGPFAGQLFVSDQHHASVMRVFLEEVDGHWQGACFPFRYGFQCGAIRLAWGSDQSLLVGMTNRGWGGRGNSPWGLQRLQWTGKVPFEIHEMRATPDGFELVFTQPVDARTASDPKSYALESYTYELHESYGSDEMDRAEPTITSATVSEDRRRVRLAVDGLRAGYVHELHATGVRAAEGGAPLLHAEAYYSLIRRPAPATSRGD